MLAARVIVSGTDRVRVECDTSDALTVYQSTTSGTLGTAAATGVASGTEVTGLSAGTAYYFTVEAGGIRSRVFERTPWEVVTEPAPDRVFIDRATGTLWGIDNAGLALHKSNDNGSTWAQVKSVTGEALYSVFVTAAGTVLLGALGKVLRSTDAGANFTDVLTLTNASARVWNWSWAQDYAGNLYAGEYGSISDGAGGFENVAYLWKSTNDGANWTRIDYFAALTDKHLHQVSVNPHSGRLYVTIGDSLKRCYYSDDAGGTWTKFGGDDTGFTMITFTPDRRLMVDDQAPGGNSIWSTTDDSTLVKVWTPPAANNTQIYTIVAFDGTDVWAAAMNEDNDADRKTSVYRSRDAGRSWEVFADAPGVDGDMHWLGFDRWHQAQAQTYVMAQAPTASGLIRFDRRVLTQPARRRWPAAYRVVSAPFRTAYS